LFPGPTARAPRAWASGERYMGFRGEVQREKKPITTTSAAAPAECRDAGRAAAAAAGGGRLLARAAGERGRAPPATTNRFACVPLITALCRRRGGNDPLAVAREVWSGRCWSCRPVGVVFRVAPAPWPRPLANRPLHRSPAAAPLLC
jgi:hypothetical protein